MTEKENEEKDRPLLFYGYLGILCMVFTIIAICTHYGWMEPRADTNYTPEDIIYIAALACGLFVNLISSRFINEYDNIHPFIRLVIRIFHWILFAVFLIATLDVTKRDDVDWVQVGLILVAGIVIFGVWAYMLKRTDKNGETYEDRIERTSKERSKKLRIKRYDEREVMESRSAMGLPNPGQAEIAWDNRHTYINVKRCTVAFVSMLVFLSVAATVGKHLDSGDGATGAFMFAFLVGALMLRIFIYNLPHCAVLHGAMRYEEGAKYGLLMIGGYSVFCNILSCIVMEASKPVWDIWGYVIFLVGTFLMFFLTYLIVTAGNRHNGHEFAFFDTDDYAKSQKDPREEEEEKE